jgi:hypothetical protein
MDPDATPDWVKNIIVKARLKPATLDDVKSACATLTDMFCHSVTPAEVKAFGRMSISNSRCVVYLDYMSGGAIVQLAVECWRSDRTQEPR